MKRKKKITTTYIKQGGNKESKLTALPSDKLIPMCSGGDPNLQIELKIYRDVPL